MDITIKKVASVLNPPAPHMVGDGFRVHNFFPGGNKLKMSPFYLLDYNAKVNFSARQQPRGVGAHPHRGFETVTIAYQGAVAHHDSAGNSGLIFPGDVQWMTAGKGILHKEYHEQEYSLKGGDFQMVQLWVNLPAKFKMTTPKYQGIKASDIKQFRLPEDQGSVKVIAGHFNGVDGTAFTFSPIEMYELRLKAEARLSLSLPAHYNTGIMVIEGAIKVNDQEKALADQFVYFENGGTDFSVEALEETVVLILSGEPINEPIVSYGPFLMNKPEEIQQAIADYNEGKFGYLEE
ncbi:pirin family protein [Pedobacter sp.]|uniref:pirin family protein n=1 Tax=Pedobacter sp. TaxID=1411316 RepID=UPI003D7F94D0